MQKHHCIKCRMEYESDDSEAYYCPACNQQRLAVASALDAKFNTVGQEPNSGLKEYDSSPKIKGFVITKL